jgi:FeS assembly SUF system regulator
MIKLSKLTDYAVVALSEMAREKGAMVTAPDLAVKTGLPEPTISKVLKLLAKAEVIASTRGANGGYQLQREPQSISMASVISALEGPVALTACVEGSHECCSHERSCPMKGQWNPVNAAMQQALESVSLEQMMR